MKPKLSHLGIGGRASLVCGLALAFGSPAFAQDQQPQTTDDAADIPEDSDKRTIVVTGTRIDRPGYEAPTPTTVIGNTELRIGGRTSVGAVLADLPQVRATTNPVNSAPGTSAASWQMDIRGLGRPRTLTLLNGRRFVGEADLNSIPFVSVKRIEVVTGGASAAWGSGAVAGVINVILNDEQKGVTLGAETGIASRGDGAEYRAFLTAGTTFGGGRGQIGVAAEYVDNKGIRPRIRRRELGRTALLNNPNFTPTNGQHQLFVADDVRAANLARGGLIVSGPLAGQVFNPDGTLRPFQFGSIRSGNQMVGGEGPNDRADITTLSSPSRRVNILGDGSYELTDSIRLSGELRYHTMTIDTVWQADNDPAASISINNAFLPAAVRSALVARGQSSFTLGRFNEDFGAISLHAKREIIQVAVAADGEFGSDWRWDAYLSHGTLRESTFLSNMRIVSNYLESVDSVISPTTGRPICRSALTVPTTACVPVNLFGEGAPSAEALRYFMGTGSRQARTTLDVGGATLRGEPFSLPGGSVSIAVGAEARREAIVTVGDPLSAARRFAFLNLATLTGGFSVREGFGEVLIPLLRNAPLAHALNLNAAARISDYSTSGSIWSWKVGATHDIVDGIRLRAVRSRDIRAGDITELFSVTALTLGSVTDPARNVTAQVRQITGGNPNLEPEVSKTWTAGFVLQPKFIPGLSLSADYYDIDISGAIATTTAQNIVNACQRGDAAQCGLITRDSSGAIVEVRRNFINLTRLQGSGIDFELSYKVPLAAIASIPGSLRLQAFASHVRKLISDDGTAVTDGVGSLGGNVAFSIPSWRGSVSATYRNDNFTVDLRARYIGSGSYNRFQDIANNHIGARIYIDAGVEFDVPDASGSEFSVFGKVANLFDKPGPLNANQALYDVTGTYATVGARMKF